MDTFLLDFDWRSVELAEASADLGVTAVVAADFGVLVASRALFDRRADVGDRVVTSSH